MLVDLSSIPADAVVGGKAQGLLSLTRAGAPVPPAMVVVANAPDEFIEQISEEVERRFAGETLAVRSSAVSEDLMSASFAGQYDTVLGVAAESRDIAAAIRRVRASIDSAHVESYTVHRLDGMAVLIMPMVEAVSAGVAFTRDPVTGERRVVIEAVAGTAQDLAAGVAVGERWFVEGDTTSPSNREVLDEAMAREIAALARRCEEIQGSPQDIEWAYDGERLYVLQSRPITTHAVEPIPIDDEPPPGPWEWDSTHNQVPMTPLSMSVFMPGFEAASRRLVGHYGLPLDRLAMRSINGYIYIQSVPVVGKPGSAPPPGPLAKLAFRLVPPLRRAARTAQRALDERVDRRLAQEWETEARPEIEAKLGEWFDLDPDSLDLAELADLAADAIDTARATFGWNMVTDPYYLIPLATLNSFIGSRGLGDMQVVTRLVAGSIRSEVRESLAELAQRLSPQVRGVIEQGGRDVLERIEEVDPGFAGRYGDHLRAHGQRLFGFDLTAPTVVEDPNLELRWLLGDRAGPDANGDAGTLANEIRSGLSSGDATEFDMLLEDARATYPIREHGEAVHARAFGAVRLVGLEIGNRMVSAGHATLVDDVFYLEVEEVLGWLVAPTDLRDIIRVRRGQHSWAKMHRPPATIGGSAALPDSSVLPDALKTIVGIFDLVLAHDTGPTDLPDGVDGVPASSGTFTGPARLVANADHLSRVRPGDVLIAPLTTSPWEIVFPQIGALVTEGGGQLSHPAIVAREYGLPAVVGCVGAMGRFTDGQLVTVDGTAGTVREVDPYR